MHLVVNLAILVLVVAFVLAAIRSRSPLAWGALPFVFLATTLSLNVWRETHDFVRVLSPVFTAIPFLFAASLQEERRDRASLETERR